jgi:hypothetical protein
MRICTQACMHAWMRVCALVCVCIQARMLRTCAYMRVCTHACPNTGSLPLFLYPCLCFRHTHTHTNTHTHTHTQRNGGAEGGFRFDALVLRLWRGNIHYRVRRTDGGVPTEEDRGRQRKTEKSLSGAYTYVARSKEQGAAPGCGCTQLARSVAMLSRANTGCKRAGVEHRRSRLQACPRRNSSLHACRSRDLLAEACLEQACVSLLGACVCKHRRGKTGSTDVAGRGRTWQACYPLTKQACQSMYLRSRHVRGNPTARRRRL